MAERDDVDAVDVEAPDAARGGAAGQDPPAAQDAGAGSDAGAADGPAAQDPPRSRAGAPARRRPRRRSGGGSRLRGPHLVAAIACAVALVALAAAGWLLRSTAELRADAADREDVLAAGELVAVRITTFEGATIDAWLAETQQLATGEFAQELARLFDDELRQGLAANEVQSVGQITSSFVQDVDGDQAAVFAVVRQTYTYAELEQQISDELRMDIDLVRGDDGAWRASSVAVLGPSTIVPVDQEGQPSDGAAPAPVPSAGAAPAGPADPTAPPAEEGP